jgi:hypothetical protein
MCPNVKGTENVSWLSVAYLIKSSNSVSALCLSLPRHFVLIYHRVFRFLHFYYWLICDSSKYSIHDSYNFIVLDLPVPPFIFQIHFRICGYTILTRLVRNFMPKVCLDLGECLWAVSSLFSLFHDSHFIPGLTLVLYLSVAGPPHCLLRGTLSILCLHCCYGCHFKSLYFQVDRIIAIYK